MKKNYIKPESISLDLQIENAILQGSDVEMNEEETTNEVMSNKKSKIWDSTLWGE
ncbi:MAG: hypothetical protein Q4E59_02315 [Bacteroidales bacterium]|nr:hypothetical protein [Bacteroidales bacterium]